jgi:hypothetical protein
MFQKHIVGIQKIYRSLDEAAPAFRAGRAEVERLVSAMLSGSQVEPRAKAILGKDADVTAALETLMPDLHTVVSQWIIAQGGKVSGASAATVKTALRGMAQGEDAPPPPVDPVE